MDHSTQHQQVLLPPPVLMWFRVYCGFMALLYLLCTPMMFFVFMFEEPPGHEENTIMMIFSIIGAGICLALCIAFLIPLFVKPQPWVWVYDLVMICIGLTSACFLFICIPLLIFWLKPETKAYFGRT